MKIAYVLARKDYFELGKNGRVAHAAGIVKGLLKNKVNLTVLSSNSASGYCSKGAEYPTIRGKGLVWHFSLVSWLFKKNKEIDFVIIRYSTMMGWFYCLVCNHIFPSRWGFELNGLGYHQWSSGENFKKRFAVKILKPAERLVISKAPFVNCVSKKLMDEISQLNSNVIELPNAGHKLAIDNVLYTNNEDKPIKLIYFGMYHHYYSLVDLAKELASFENEGIELHFYGSGEQEDELKRIARDNSKIFVHGRYKLESLISNGVFYGKVFLVLPYKEGTIADYGSPTKLFEYMALGLPIVSTSVGQPYDLLIKRKELYPQSVFFYKSKIYELISELLTCKNINQNELVEFFIAEHTWEGRCRLYLDKVNKFLVDSEL